MEQNAAPETSAPPPLTAEEWTDPGDPAGLWVRAGAAFIDGLALFAGIFASAVAAVAMTGDSKRAEPWVQAATVILGGLYYTGLTGFAGQTVGKMAAGVRVVTKTGGAVGYGRALGRWAAYSLSSLPLGLGFAAAAFNRDRRTVHDFVAGTRVVYVPGVGRARKAVMAGFGVTLCVSAVLATGAAMLKGPGSLEWRERLGREGAAVGTLKAVRTLVAFYEAEKGAKPGSLDDLKAMSDFTGLPTLELPDHEATAKATAYAGIGAPGELDGRKLGDTGGWGYVGDKTDPAFGTVFIDCTHVDSDGNAWHQY